MLIRASALRRRWYSARRTLGVASVALAASLAASGLVDVEAAGATQGQTAPAPQGAAATGCRVTGRVTTLVAAPAGFANFGQGRGQGQAGGQGRGTGAAPAAAAPTGAAPAATPPAAPAKIETPLPGATLVVHQGARLVVATSTEVDGQYAIRFTPGQTFHVTAEMMSFASESKAVSYTHLTLPTIYSV